MRSCSGLRFHRTLSCMARFKKTLLGARTYHSPDGVLEVTPARLRHWSDTFARFKQKNLAVPISWGHAADPANSQPIKSKSRPPQDTVGYLEQFKLAPDGTSAEVLINVPRDEDAQKVKANLAELSPVIFESWKDGDGTEWRDCITHVDLVQHPVDHHQTEFQPVVACAFRMGLDKGKPVTYRMQGEEMEGEEKEQPEAKDPPEESPVENEGDRLKKVLDALAAHQIVLSDDTNEENFLEHLEQALLTAAAMGGTDAGGMDEPPTEVTQPEFAMSLDKKIAESPELARQRKYLDQQHRGTVATRLSAILSAGQCTPAEYKAKQPALKAVRLSLDDEGNAVAGSLETWIASRESIPRGTFWDPDTRTRAAATRMDVVERPEGLVPMTAEDADKVADEVLGRKK